MVTSKRKRTQKRKTKDMSRRDFLKTGGRSTLLLGGVILGGGLAISVNQGCKKDDSSPASPGASQY